MCGLVEAKNSIEVKCWFRKNWKKFFSAGFLTFGILSIIALTQGIGYEATVKISSVEIIVPDHPCYGFFVTGNVTYTFNPFLYPVTHIFGYENNFGFMRVSEPYDDAGLSVKDDMEIAAALKEFPKNIPFYLTISFVVAFGSIKLTEQFSLIKKRNDVGKA